VSDEQLCRFCGRPIATLEQRKSIPDGEGPHLCWGTDADPCAKDLRGRIHALEQDLSRWMQENAELGEENARWRAAAQEAARQRDEARRSPVLRICADCGYCDRLEFCRHPERRERATVNMYAAPPDDCPIRKKKL
jgi:hypothetical protein